MVYVQAMQSSHTYLNWTNINITLQVCYMWLLGPSFKVFHLSLLQSIPNSFQLSTQG